MNGYELIIGIAIGAAIASLFWRFIWYTPPKYSENLNIKAVFEDAKKKGIPFKPALAGYNPEWDYVWVRKADIDIEMAERDKFGYILPSALFKMDAKKEYFKK